MKHQSEMEKLIQDFGINSSYFKGNIEREIQSNCDGIHLVEEDKRAIMFDLFKKQCRVKFVNLNSSLNGAEFRGELEKRRGLIGLDIKTYSKIFKIPKEQLNAFFDGKQALANVKVSFLTDLIDFFSIPFAVFKKYIIEEDIRINANKLLYTTHTNYFKKEGKKQHNNYSESNKLETKISDVKKSLKERSRFDLL